MKYLWLTLALVGCAQHTVEKAQNAAIGIEYQAALEKCMSDALASKAASGDAGGAYLDYANCANAADLIYGRK